MERANSESQITGGVEINNKIYYGLDAESQLKLASKYDYNLEFELREWLESILNITFSDKDNLQTVLMDGISLLKLVNKMSPGIISSSQFNQRKIALHYVTNHKLVLKALLDLGLKHGELYNPNDLMTGRHPEEFLNCLEAIARLIASNDKYSHLRRNLPQRLLQRSKSTPSKRWPKVETHKRIDRSQSMRVAGDVDEIRHLRSELVRMTDLYERSRAENRYLRRKQRSWIVYCLPRCCCAPWSRRSKVIMSAMLLMCVGVGTLISVKYDVSFGDAWNGAKNMLPDRLKSIDTGSIQQSFQSAMSKFRSN